MIALRIHSVKLCPLIIAMMHYTICESNWVHIWHIIADAFFDPIPLQFRYGKFVLISCAVPWFAFVKIQKRVYQIDSLRLCFTFVSIGFRICKEYILHAKLINKITIEVDIFSLFILWALKLKMLQWNYWSICISSSK